jgi:hypothetical protein
MANLVLIKTFLHRHEAESARGLLKEQNIQSIILADDAGGKYPGASLGMGNVKLLVPEADAPKAKEFLQVLDTVVDGELWEEDMTTDTLPEAKLEPTIPVPKKDNWLLVVIGLLVLLSGIIYFLKQK